MLNGNKGFLIGCSLCFVGLFASGSISFTAFCEGTAFLVSLSVLAFIGRKAYRRIKPHKPAIQARLSRLGTGLRKVAAKKQPTADKAKLTKDLYQLLAVMKKDMEAFSLTWSKGHANQQNPKLITLLSYRNFASELQSLTKSLNHLGKPGDDARLELPDLKLYQEWATDLQQRFKTFQSFSMQQEKEVVRALANAKEFHGHLGETYPQAQETPEYWTVYGGLTTLVHLQCEGYIPAELLLPQMQSLQSEMEQLLDRHEHDGVYRLVL
jgi:hypothetical protein